MATAAIDIFNLALSEIGARAAVSSLTESSREAEICRLWYDQTVEQVLAMAPWPAATAAQRLALLAERDGDWDEGDPLPGYNFTYKLPFDNIRPRYLDTFGTFEVGLTDDGETVLFTNLSEAILIYTKRLLSPNLWDPSLRMAIIYTLAAHIVMPLTGKPGRAKEVEEKAREIVLAAHVAAANQNQNSFEPALPDWITARGYGGGVSLVKFIYPSAPFLVHSNVS